MAHHDSAQTSASAYVGTPTGATGAAGATPANVGRPHLPVRCTSANLNDAAFLFNLEQQVYPPDDALKLHEIHDRLRNDGARIARYGKETVGVLWFDCSACIYPHARKQRGGGSGDDNDEPITATVNDIVVHPAWRMRGVATSLVRDLMKWTARASGLVRLRLMVEEHDERLWRVLARLGWSSRLRRRAYGASDGIRFSWTAACCSGR